MKPGRQWLVFDADFFDNNFTAAVLNQFGTTGIVLFVAFLCAAKRNHVQGQIRYRSELEALEQMGIADVELLDSAGKPFTLDDFWALTGRFKQTIRTTRGHTLHVSATGWEDWQQSLNSPETRSYERDRKRRWRANFVRDIVPPDIDSDSDIEKRGDMRPNNKAKPVAPTAAPIPEWDGDPAPDEPVVDIKAALAELKHTQDTNRANRPT